VNTWFINCSPIVSRTIFRPAIVLGDSRRPETTQFDMVQAFSVLASFPVLPLRAADRIDIVLQITSARPSSAFIQKEATGLSALSPSSGTGSETYAELTDALAQAGGSPNLPAFAGRTFFRTMNCSRTRKTIWDNGCFAPQSFLAVSCLEHGL